jgi:tRNA (guanine26-N2/guanine27-N2)-dimethyltransferase
MSVDNRKRKHDESSVVGVRSITEGSATMAFPSDQESTVFYNPVQVQNRDLSVLMISLYAERRAVRRAVLGKKKELLPQKLPQEKLHARLTEFERSLDPTKLVTHDGITVLDALAASGLRSIRYWNEIPGVKHVTINDLEEAATERAHENLQRNGLNDVLLQTNVNRDRGICINHGDATHEMYLSRRPQQQQQNHHNVNTSPMNQQRPMWDVIDLDPYGSAAPFLDGAVQAVESGGLLCITCTDMAALGGSHPETAYGRYAGLPIQSAGYLQELALRILLHTIAVSAARYKRTIRPVLSVGMAFYVRVFVEVHDDKKGVTNLSLNIGNVYQSTKCSSFFVLPHGQMGGAKGNVYQSVRLTPSVCPETGANLKIGGPLWMGPLHDQDIVSIALKRLSDKTCTSPNMELIATRTRLQGLLTSVSEELDTPLYYTMPGLCQTLRCSTPTNKEFKSAIVNAGYKVSGYHKEATAIKTNAPDHVVWDIMRAWIEKHPLKKEPEKESPAAKILAKKRTVHVDFSLPKNGLGGSKSSNEKISRFPMNPESHWGPKRMATGKKKEVAKVEPKENS